MYRRIEHLTWRSAKRMLASVALGAAGGFGLYKMKEGQASVVGRPFRLQAAASVPSKDAEYLPTATWDQNWDKRHPASAVRRLKEGAKQEQVADYEQNLNKVTPKAKRVLILVRHGQYNITAQEDSERYLTLLGKKQADLTGARLAALTKLYEQRETGNSHGKKLNISLIMSTMMRATETAQIILEHFPNIPLQSCDLICEGAPCPPVPNVLAGTWDPEPHQFFEDGARIEAGYRKYFHRSDPSQEEDSVELLVCHGNVIRYFICRVLQLPPQAWLRFALHNCSYTIVTIFPSGRVSVSALGEAGHLPVDKLTFN